VFILTFGLHIFVQTFLGHCTNTRIIFNFHGLLDKKNASASVVDRGFELWSGQTSDYKKQYVGVKAKTGWL
jgi:hypothetical protein